MREHGVVFVFVFVVYDVIKLESDFPDLPRFAGAKTFQQKKRRRGDKYFFGILFGQSFPGILHVLDIPSPSPLGYRLSNKVFFIREHTRASIPSGGCPRTDYSVACLSLFIYCYWLLLDTCNLLNWKKSFVLCLMSYTLSVKKIVGLIFSRSKI